MTALSINKEFLRNEDESSQTLEQMFKHILHDVISDEDVITAITVNGHPLSQEEEAELSNVNISEFDEIDFSISNSMDLAFEALDSCSSYLDLATERIQFLSKCYASNDFDRANKAFGDVIEIMDLFIQLISKIHKKLETKSQGSVNGKEIQKLEIHLLSVLKALVPAKEKNDIIMLCDLLEYELIDNLTQWKIKIIPEMKSLKAA